MDAAIAVAHARLGNLPDPFLEVGLIYSLATIVVARSFRPERSASTPDADLPSAANIIDQLAPPIRPQSFRETTSCSIALSSERSATRRFSFAFSSSSWRNRFISDGIRPAYFFRQLY